MAQPQSTPKTMSSRLLTMKFMQRSANTTSSGPRTPESSTLPPSKRQRLSNGYHSETPTSTVSDEPALSESPNGEDQRYSASHGRDENARSETKWYLKIAEPHRQSPTESPLRIVSAGFSALDSTAVKDADERSGQEGDAQEASARRVVSGRRSFGKFNKVLERQQNPDASSDTSDDSEDSEEAEHDGNQDGGSDEDDPTGASAMIRQARKEASERARAERKAKRKAEKVESERLAAERRARSINLNKISSISSGGGRPNAPPNLKDMTCHRCNQKGHMRKDCPQGSYSR